jgi:TonB family protein
MGLRAFAAAALVLILVISAVLLRSHRIHPTPPIPKSQTAASGPAATHLSRATKKSRSKATPVNETAAANQVLPDVPAKARSTIQGTIRVSIRVNVDPSGAVSDATIDSAGSKYFANLALQAARQWRFKPSPAREQAASRVFLLRFEFTQSATRAIPVEVTR